MRTTTKIGLALIVGLGTLGSTSHAQVTKKGDAYLLRMKFKPRQTIRYALKVNQTVAAGSQGFVVTGPMVMQVGTVQGGVATVTASVGAMKSNGRVIRPAAPPVTVKVNSQGKIVGGPKGASTNFPVLPGSPVRVGQSWTAAVPIAQLGNTRAVYKFLGLSNVGGKQFGRIGITLNASGQLKMSGTGTSLVSMADGLPHSTNINLTMTMGAPARRGSKPLTMRMKMSMSRL